MSEKEERLNYIHASFSIQSLEDVSIRKTSDGRIQITGKGFTIFTRVDVMGELTRLSLEAKNG